MKKIIFFSFTFISFSVFASAQKLKEAAVPAATKTSFKTKFPGTMGQWEKEDGNYEVTFKENGKSRSAIIDSKGTIIEIETDIVSTELPSTALAYIKKHYTNPKIKGAAKVEKPNGTTNYEATINGKDLLFDTNGTFIKASKE